MNTVEDLKPARLRWSIKKRLLIIGLPIAIVAALAIGLGVGLGVGLHRKHDDSEASSEPAAASSSSAPAANSSSVSTTNSSSASTQKYWTPKVGTTWQIELLYPINDTAINVEVFDIDLFDTPKSTIDKLHEDGRKVICYFSAGSYEDWRPDAHKFNESDLGSPLDGWPGERWLNTSSESVRNIMKSRLDLAVSKNCDGVDPDNVDGYDNDNGLDLTSADATDYVNFLADEAHSRNLAIGLKNAEEIIGRVIDKMQWSVNEQCAQYNECDNFMPFIKAGKPVFHIEYPKGDSDNNDDPVSADEKKSACDFANSKEFSTLIKNMDLDNWYENC
ncbi:hypothetical protein TRVA0_024S00144 [Trichomonascus vanleenenianus]|uniref:endo alpha-1,4 polygalactosaminidase n=1 Tax=Trichomonascus vanleenenianus TaxID=2268995 RepID=UPI003EC98E98